MPELLADKTVQEIIDMQIYRSAIWAVATGTRSIFAKAEIRQFLEENLGASLPDTQTPNQMLET